MASSSSRQQIQPPLRQRDGPLVWIDCEMTGLNHHKDVILEIAVLITNGNLDIVDEGIEFVIKTDKQVLDEMDPWCVENHGRTGLTKACIESSHEYQDVADAVLAYVKKWIPDARVGILAGSSVHADKMFLAEGMSELVKHLHYRIVDVSTIKELCHRWYPEMAGARSGKVVAHRALDDIRGSIDELKFYRKNIFVPPRETSARSSGKLETVFD